MFEESETLRQRKVPVNKNSHEKYIENSLLMKVEEKILFFRSSKIN